MAVTSAVIGAVAAVAGTAVAYSGQQSAKRAAAKNRELQENAQSEQKAAAAQAAADDRRRQVREERVRRARIIQASVNTGATESSGEAGATGALSTNLSQGLGTSVGGQQRATAIGGYLQEAANAKADVQRGQANVSLGNQISSLGGSIFNATGGFNTIFSANFSTAARYGTNPGSQQTQMLAGQDL